MLATWSSLAPPNELDHKIQPLLLRNHRQEGFQSRGDFGQCFFRSQTL